MVPKEIGQAPSMPTQTIDPLAREIRIDQRFGNTVAILNTNNNNLEISIFDYPTGTTKSKVILLQIPQVSEYYYYHPYLFGKSILNDLIIINIDTKDMDIKNNIQLYSVYNSKIAVAYKNKIEIINYETSELEHTINVSIPSTSYYITFNENYVCVLEGLVIHVYSYATGESLQTLGNYLESTSLVLKDDYFVGIAKDVISVWNLNDSLVQTQFQMMYIPSNEDAYPINLTVNQAFKHIESKYQATPIRRVK